MLAMRWPDKHENNDLARMHVFSPTYEYVYQT